MDAHTLWSLRLGFSSREAGKIEKLGIKRFVQKSFAKPEVQMPSFLDGLPKTPAEVLEANQKNSGEQARKQANRERYRTNLELKAWWIDRMRTEEYPLREKMTLFWHNHFVAAHTRVSYWMYANNSVLRENAFGNLRELTKKVLHTNNMLRYLDNNKNVKGKINENLSRELLELFTLGIGNYTEEDIKNGAKGLAGLTMGDAGGVYNKGKENNEAFTYLGEKGNFKANDLVDIIFEHKNAPYHITRKILKWFIYDNPPEELVTYYGDYLRDVDYELEPFMLKVFTEEFARPVSGTKIKDPLLYTLQLLHELDLKEVNSSMVALFMVPQGMDLYNQPNVKGWGGGNYWLSAQIYGQRHKLADLICNSKSYAAGKLKFFGAEANGAPDTIDPKLKWNQRGNNRQVIAELSGRLLFSADKSLQADFETILRHDFDPSAKGAESGVMQLFNFMIKTPEFQLI